MCIGKLMILSTAFRSEVRGSNSPLAVRELQIGGTGVPVPIQSERELQRDRQLV